MVAIALTSLPEEPAAAAEATAEESAAAAPTDVDDDDAALAGRFLAAKRALCADALQYVRGTIERVERGDSNKAARRGGLRKKAATGVRQRSARKQGAARAAAAPARGFGA